ncbi:hypothetical protein LCGC14_2111590 [marine sediment metagenome]|uniref:site-specific DNA-methyltransferase (cytosine-N(4)-specific) n=1 Tax=marine sediment metagenome TaxID=412755 RepID=A0A0F9E722_9ZZZZ
MNIDILVGDSLHLPLPDKHFHTCVTSPPYWGLRDYGLGSDSLGLEPTPELYVQHLVDIFREVRRTLRDDGTLWLNLGDSYASQGGSRDYGSSDNGTGRGPAVGGNRAPSPGLKPKDLVGIPWMVAFALRADGWYLRSDIIWHKPNVMPESVRDRPTKAHEYLFLLSKSKRYYYDGEANKEPTTGTARKCGQNSRANVDRDVLHGTRKQDAIGKSRYVGFNDRYDFANPSKKRNRRSVWNIATQPYPDAHFATFPEKLVEPCILAGCLEGGTVLDPFAGSGTVGVVAQRLERNATLIDAKPEYCELARERVS